MERIPLRITTQLTLLILVAALALVVIGLATNVAAVDEWTDNENSGNARWLESGDSIGPVHIWKRSDNVNTDWSGSFAVHGITPGIYEIKVKNFHTIQNRKLSVNLAAGNNVLFFGTLLEGDASDDDIVDIVDFSILRTVFGSSDTHADFNQDGVVDILDFSLLRTNFGTSGPVTVAASEEKEPANTRSIRTGHCKNR